MKCKLRFTESSKLVYYFVKLIGLAPFALEDSRLVPPTLLDLVYPVIMAFGHLLLMTMSTAALTSQLGEDDYQESVEIWGIVQYVVCLPATFTTLFVIILARKKITRLVNELCDMDDKLNTFNVEEKPEQFFDSAIATTAIANAVVATICVLAGRLEPNWHVLGSIEYGVGSCFNLNVLLVYVKILCCIRQHFEQLNRILLNKFIQSSNFTARELGLSRSEVIRKTKALHSELSDLLNRTSDVFALPILLSNIHFFCVIVVSGQWIFGVVKFSSSDTRIQEYFSSGTFGIWCPLLRMTIVVGEILVISYTSASTGQQKNSTRAMLIDVSNTFTPTKLQDEFFMFSIQLADEPVAASAFGISDMDYSHVYKVRVRDSILDERFPKVTLVIFQMFGSAIAYVLVIVQFGGEKLNPYSKDA